MALNDVPQHCAAATMNISKPALPMLSVATNAFTLLALAGKSMGILPAIDAWNQ